MSLNRRLFLQASGAASLGYLFSAPKVSAARIRGANDRLKVAGVGVGGKGRSDIEQAGNLMEVIALCDIDTSDKHLGGASKKFPDAKTFTDYRKMYDTIGKDIDAAVVSTPDHSHALAAAMAIRLGKHVYVQKPLTRTVYEAMYLKKLAAEHKVCTQMGNQGTTLDGLRRAVELIQSGVIGDVTEVHVWTNRPIWPQAPEVTKQLKEMPIPEHVKWQDFLGPAPERPYNRGYHPFAWRGWWDYGTGAIGDMACHTANMAFMALKLEHPTQVSATATGVNDQTCPGSAHCRFEYPARDTMPALVLHWYEGKVDGKKLTPPKELLEKVLKKGEKLANSGSMLVGSKGILFSPNDYGAEFRITPGELVEGMNIKTPEKLPSNNGHDQGQKNEWVAAIKANDPTKALSNFDYASMLTSSFLLGNVAIRTGKSFEFDSKTLETKGCPEGAEYIKQVARKGWELE